MAVIVALAGCVSMPGPAPRPGAPAPPSLGFFSRIKVPDGYEPALRLNGKGVQIFRCEAIDSEYLWRFRQPEADLTDDSGQLAARHGANFTFEHRDGSRLLATITAYDDAPKRDDLRWVLMSAKSFGKGAFATIAYVQRVNTSGGMPPASCQATEVNRLLRVSFSSDFVFYRARQ
jgi:hypothetical protein